MYLSTDINMIRTMEARRFYLRRSPIQSKKECLNYSGGVENENRSESGVVKRGINLEYMSLGTVTILISIHL